MGRVELGLTNEEFWDLTPLEYYHLLKARQNVLRLLDAFQANIALYSAVGPRIKSPKKRLRDYLLLRW